MDGVWERFTISAKEGLFLKATPWNISAIADNLNIPPIIKSSTENGLGILDFTYAGVQIEPFSYSAEPKVKLK